METRPKSEGDLQESSGRRRSCVFSERANEGEAGAAASRATEGTREKSKAVGGRTGGAGGSRSLEEEAERRRAGRSGEARSRATATASVER